MAVKAIEILQSGARAVSKIVSAMDKHAQYNLALKAAKTAALMQKKEPNTPFYVIPIITASSAYNIHSNAPSLMGEPVRAPNTSDMDKIQTREAIETCAAEIFNNANMPQQLLTDYSHKQTISDRLATKHGKTVVILERKIKNNDTLEAGNMSLTTLLSLNNAKTVALV